MWTYKGKPVTDIKTFPKGCIGFVYKVCDNNGKCYVGQKSLYSKRWIEVSKNVYDRLKKEGAEVKKTRNKAKSKKGAVVWRYKKYVEAESNWKVYKTSNKELMKSDQPVREILDFAFSKKQLSYLEIKWMFHYNVLEVDNFYNDNILGKFFRRDT